MEISSFKKNILEKKYDRRSFLIGSSQLLLVGLLIRQMRHIQINENEKYKLLAEENRIDIEILPPLRGIIFDNNGIILAKNKENYRIRIKIGHNPNGLNHKISANNDKDIIIIIDTFLWSNINQEKIKQIKKSGFSIING